MIDRGYATIQKKEGYIKLEYDFFQIIKLLEYDCLPIALVCRVTEDKKKEILTDTLWMDIFSFLDNKKKLKSGKDELYFKDMSEDKRECILNSRIYSIWIRGAHTDTWHDI